MKYARNALNKLYQIVANRRCLLCLQNSSHLICRFCEADLPAQDLAKCQGNLLHQPNIRAGFKTLNFDRLLAVSDYIWPYDSLLTGLKFRRRLTHAKALADLFSSVAGDYINGSDSLLVPIPLHRKRLMSRGFNQAVEIARYLARRHQLPLATDVLKRVNATQAQTGLSRAARTRNLKAAFELNKFPDVSHVILFDDVVTTGATINSVCETLKAYRPDLRIDVWAICVTLAHR